MSAVSLASTDALESVSHSVGNTFSASALNCCITAAN
jgi:hypothetical protein